MCTQIHTNNYIFRASVLSLRFRPGLIHNRRYNRPIIAPICIKPVHSSLSYQQAIHQKYDRRGRELPSGYGPLVVCLFVVVVQRPTNSSEFFQDCLNVMLITLVLRHRIGD